MMLTEMGEHVSLYMTPAQHRPREAGDADLPPVVLRHLPGEEDRARTPRWAWPRTPGRSTRGSSTTRTFLQLTYDIDHEREDDVLRRARAPARAARWSASSTPPTASSTCSGATSRRGTRRRHGAGASPASTRTPSSSSTSTTTRFVGRGAGQAAATDDMLMVLSDHGFTSFRRGVNLNAWLPSNGYLHAQGGRRRRASGCADVDWSRTKAYALGLTGMFLNLEGPRGAGHRRARRGGRRRSRTSSSPALDRPAGRGEGRGRRSGRSSTPPELYHGPYLGEAPDLLVGYNHGYRASWDCATGVVAGPGLRGQHQGLERRPLRRPAPGARGPLLQPPHRRRRPRPHRHRADGAAPVRHPAARPTWTARPLFEGAPRRRQPAKALAMQASTDELSSCVRAPRVGRRCRALAGCRPAAVAPRARPDPGAVIVLGFDGMDYALTTRLMAEGRLPELWRAWRRRAASPPLGTSVPPQSPVAWSDFITGVDAGRPRHLRLHPPRPRDDDAVPLDQPRHGAAAALSSASGGWQFPLDAGKVELLRHGEAFWEVLEEHGVPTTIIRMPANFPPSGTAEPRALRAWGRPTSSAPTGRSRSTPPTALAFLGERRSSGGEVITRRGARRGRRRPSSTGPTNPFRRDARAGLRTAHRLPGPRAAGGQARGRRRGADPRRRASGATGCAVELAADPDPVAGGDQARFYLQGRCGPTSSST